MRSGRDHQSMVLIACKAMLTSGRGVHDALCVSNCARDLRWLDGGGFRPKVYRAGNVGRHYVFRRRNRCGIDRTGRCCRRRVDRIDRAGRKKPAAC